jgi:hypothetical protein
MERPIRGLEEPVGMCSDALVIFSGRLVITVLRLRQRTGPGAEGFAVSFAWRGPSNASGSGAARLSLRRALDEAAPGEGLAPMSVAERYAIDVQLGTGGRHLLELGRIAVAVRRRLGPSAFAAWLVTEYPGEEGIVIDLMGIASAANADPAAALAVMERFLLGW